jgi:hypothetical protein
MKEFFILNIVSDMGSEYFQLPCAIGQNLDKYFPLLFSIFCEYILSFLKIVGYSC